jgi:hypothetical protein
LGNCDQTSKAGRSATTAIRDHDVLNREREGVIGGAASTYKRNESLWLPDVDNDVFTCGDCRPRGDDERDSAAWFLPPGVRDGGQRDCRQHSKREKACRLPMVHLPLLASGWPPGGPANVWAVTSLGTPGGAIVY